MKEFESFITPTHNQQVVGSSPTGTTLLEIRRLQLCKRLFFGFILTYKYNISTTNYLIQR